MGKDVCYFLFGNLPFIKFLFTNFLIVLDEQTVKIIFSRSNYLFSLSEKYYKRTVFSILKSFNNCWTYYIVSYCWNYLKFIIDSFPSRKWIVWCWLLQILKVKQLWRRHLMKISLSSSWKKSQYGLLCNYKSSLFDFTRGGKER